jgi:hypothetical protein
VTGFSAPTSPGLHIIAGEGEEWIVGDGSYKIEGYYDELLPFLARGLCAAHLAQMSLDSPVVRCPADRDGSRATGR